MAWHDTFPNVSYVRWRSYEQTKQTVFFSYNITSRGIYWKLKELGRFKVDITINFASITPWFFIWQQDIFTQKIRQAIEFQLLIENVEFDNNFNVMVVSYQDNISYCMG